jgi:hypothetical protein
MHTTFKLDFYSQKNVLDIPTVNRLLPEIMTAQTSNDEVYIVVRTSKEEDEEALPLVQRELDRISFFTGARARIEMIRRRVQASLTISYRILVPFPPELGPQQWHPTLALQLRLWSVADDIEDPPTQLMIFFQVIELAYPKLDDRSAYPKYTDASLVPHPRTEAKLLRHLVSHAGHATGKETRLYLEFIGAGPVMANRSDPTWLRLVGAKVAHVQTQAREAITFMLQECSISTETDQAG